MAVVEEFTFKLAKPKDLPPAWFELVLRPEKFQDHVNTLYKNQLIEPSALSLIATFLEKAGCIEGQTPSAEGVITEDRKEILTNCACFMAAFLKWDLLILEKGLPSAVVYSLVTSLISKFPLPPSSSTSSFHLAKVSHKTYTSHVIYCLWVVRFMTQCDILSHPPQGLLWEGTCASNDTIKQLDISSSLATLADLYLEDTSTLVTVFRVPLSPLKRYYTLYCTFTCYVSPCLDKAISLLNEACNLHINFPLPCVELQLPKSLKRDDFFPIKLPFLVNSIPWKSLHTQIYFDLGQVHFEREEYQKSIQCFNTCSRLLQDLNTIDHTCWSYPTVDIDQLKGYLSACSSFDVEWIEQEEDDTSVVTAVEQFRKEKGDLSEILPCLADLSVAYRAGLEIDIKDWSELVAMEPSTNKRARLEDVSNAKPTVQFDLWSAVCSVAEGNGVQPTALKILSPSHLKDKNTIANIVKAINEVLTNTKPETDSFQRLALFLKSIDINDMLWREHTDQYPLVSQLLTQDDFTCLASPTIDLTSRPSSTCVDPITRLAPILMLSNPSQLLTAISDLFLNSTESQQISIATMLQREEKEFLTLDQVNSPITCSQYNILLHKAVMSLKEKNYSIAVELYSAAAQFLNSNNMVPNSVRIRLIPILMEQSLKLRMLNAGKNLRSMSNKQACDKHTALLDEAKGHYGNNKNPNQDPLITTLAGVFLLNLQQYTFVARFDHMNLHERICPRLAVAAQCVKDGQDLRRCTRDLFETIFTAPMRGSNDSNQQLQRKCLELISTNLQDLVCLSYLMAALARLWNLIKKPEFEISSEYTTHWPTAVGNSSSINPDQILRVLSTTLTNSLSLLPSYSSWLIMQGDVFLATGNFVGALKCYLEAGAQESDFFEGEVPDSVWNKQVYHRLIYCCNKLDHYSHALILCQFLDPPNYSFTFSLLKEHTQHVLVSLFDYLWEMTIIEFLIYTLAKQGDSIKLAAAIQVAGRPELNTNNHKEIINQAVTVRKRTFLRTLYRTIITPSLS